jgi:hypothetical protein
MRRIWLISQLIFMACAGMLCRQSGVAEGRNGGTTNGYSPDQPVCFSVVVPSYMYPAADGSAWNSFIAHPVWSTQAERIMIVNPNSGPGKDAKADYRNIAAAAQRSGNRVYGYVSTRYGKVDPQTVEEEIGKYIKWYGVNGIFVDEVSADAAQVARYYQPLVTAITSAIDDGGVILNAGTYPDASYAQINVPKQSRLQIVVFEDSYASFIKASFVVPPWARTYPSSMFIHIVYDTPADDVAKVLQFSAMRHASYVYVTDQTMPDPYAALPSYWAELNRAAQAGCVR